MSLLFIMAPDKVYFTGFTEPFDAKKVRMQQMSNKPSYWPIEWMIVMEKTEVDNFNLSLENSSRYHKWITTNCKSRVEIARDMNTGGRVFAFEDDEEGILFKFSF